jgi:hypothetical protein
MRCGRMWPCGVLRTALKLLVYRPKVDYVVPVYGKLQSGGRLTKKQVRVEKQVWYMTSCNDVSISG